MVAAVSIKVSEPIFESQTKIKLGSKEMYKDGPSVRNYIVDFVTKELDNFLHKNPEVADAILKKIQESETIRKSNSVNSKAIRERAKRTSLHNRKLRDCNIHYDDKNPLAEESTIFITEGESASGSITTSRNADIQAVFSLRGKPLNCFKSQKKVVYENEEFNLLIAALGIDEDLDNLRYNKVVIATDADVDGMHIRLLLLTFFLKFYPDLVRQGHVYILQTPLFRVQSKKENLYCYNTAEKDEAVGRIGEKDATVTRFKGLGEISPAEFKGFIGESMSSTLQMLTPAFPTSPTTLGWSAS